MCLKLKNKILQVIEIISNYGLIFAIYKFILFIIKNLFKNILDKCSFEKFIFKINFAQNF